jgi:uncharacterized phage-associated protein
LYFLQGWYLHFYNKPFFKDPIEAWQYGPVVKEVYDEFKSYKFSPIEHIGGENYLEHIKGEDQRFLKKIMEIYGKHSAFDLAKMSHATEPWQGKYSCYFGSHKSEVIENKDLKKYFDTIYKAT